MATKRKRKRKTKKKQNHFISIGFSNRLAIYLVLLIAAGLIGGFYLALKSIVYGYTGALLCWTVVFTPIGTMCSVVLNSTVKKSENENTGADGEGVKYAAAKANNFGVDNNNVSPPI